MCGGPLKTSIGAVKLEFLPSNDEQKQIGFHTNTIYFHK